MHFSLLHSFKLLTEPFPKKNWSLKLVFRDHVGHLVKVSGSTLGRQFDRSSDRKIIIEVTRKWVVHIYSSYVTLTTAVRFNIIFTMTWYISCSLNINLTFVFIPMSTKHRALAQVSKYTISTLCHTCGFVEFVRNGSANIPS